MKKNIVLRGFDGQSTIPVRGEFTGGLIAAGAAAAVMEIV